MVTINSGLDVTFMSRFEWTEARKKAALALAEGETQIKAGELAGVTRRTIDRWLQEPEFEEEVDRLTLMTGIAGRAERLRLAKRAIKQRIDDTGLVHSKADLLDWLKFAQGETQGLKLDIAALIDATSSLAGSRPPGDIAETNGHYSPSPATADNPLP